MRKRIAFYFATLLLMLTAAAQFQFNTIRAAACCSYGENCGGKTTCCQPYNNQADCSASQKNYCRRVCGPSPD